MSDYNGPRRECKVKLLREWVGVPAGTICNAVIYTELGSVAIELPDGQKWFQIAQRDVEEVSNANQPPRE